MSNIHKGQKECQKIALEILFFGPEILEKGMRLQI